MDEVSRRSAVYGTLQAPSSKSYAQRAVAAALLAEGETTLMNMELCSDTLAAIKVAQALGAEVTHVEKLVYKIKGGVSYDDSDIGTLNPRVSDLNIGESGLSARMFTPIAALSGITMTITGHGSILKRPVGMMTGPLTELGVDVKSKKGYLPLTVRGPIKGGEAAVDGSVSSQFLTGLLMALPLARHGTTVKVSKLNSVPYIDMTLDVLESFGIEVAHSNYLEFYIEGGQRYEPRTYSVEGDWSGASCLLVAGAIAGDITVENLNPLSKQADVAIIDALSRAGAEIVTTHNSVQVKKRDLHSFSFDATHCPDLFPALVALAANCEGESIIIGTERLKHKESDRAETLREEFAKMGIEIDISEDDIMRVIGGRIRGAEVSSHNDHRIAMATAVAALNSDGDVVIKGAEAVDKSYPGFWRDLKSVTKS